VRIGTKDITTGEVGWDSVCNSIAFPSDELAGICSKDRLKFLSPSHKKCHEFLGRHEPSSPEEFVPKTIASNTIGGSDAQVRHPNLSRIE
jgi:hypothetical protein